MGEGVKDDKTRVSGGGATDLAQLSPLKMVCHAGRCSEQHAEVTDDCLPGEVAAAAAADGKFANQV